MSTLRVFSQFCHVAFQIDLKILNFFIQINQRNEFLNGMRALLILANLDEIALNLVKNEHALIRRTVEQQARNKVISVVIHHQTWEDIVDF